MAIIVPDVTGWLCFVLQGGRRGGVTGRTAHPWHPEQSDNVRTYRCGSRVRDAPWEGV